MNLKKQIAASFLTIAAFGVVPMIPVPVHSIYSIAEAAESEKENPDNAVSFTQRIQRILDEYKVEKNTKRVKPAEPPIEIESDDAIGGLKIGSQDEGEPVTLQEGRYNFDWQGTPLAQSLYTVAKISGRDIIVNGELNGKVFAKLEGATCSEALDYLSKAFNFNWVVEGDTVIISTDAIMKQSKVFQIHHAYDMDKLLEEMKAIGFEAERVYANKEARTISVTGTPYQVKEAEKRIKRLDKPVSQCLLVAQLIEINHGRDLNLGITYSLPTYSHEAETNISEGTSSSLRGWFLPKMAFGAASAASRELSKGKVISRPMITVLNGLEGSVKFGDRVPVFTTVTNSSTTNMSVEYQDVGTMLKIQPMIDEESGEITMKIEAEVSNITQWVTSGANKAPQVSTKNANTSVRLNSGDSYIIGGLMTKSEMKNLSGIPGLMNLPILGELFRFHSNSRKYSEVFIMLTPYIVSSDIDPRSLVLAETPEYDAAFSKKAETTKSN